MDQQMLLTVVLLVLVGGMLYLSTRNRKKQMAAQQERLSSIVPGVRVTTIAGLQGTVTAAADDTIELEIAPGVRTTWLRTAVRDILDAPVPAGDLAELDSSLDEPVVDVDPPRDTLETTYRTRDDKSNKDLN